jgi:hypothetical protein
MRNAIPTAASEKFPRTKGIPAEPWGLGKFYCAAAGVEGRVRPPFTPRD